MKESAKRLIIVGLEIMVMVLFIQLATAIGGVSGRIMIGMLFLVALVLLIICIFVWIDMCKEGYKVTIWQKIRMVFSRKGHVLDIKDSEITVEGPLVVRNSMIYRNIISINTDPKTTPLIIVCTPIIGRNKVFAYNTILNRWDEEESEKNKDLVKEAELAYNNYGK